MRRILITLLLSALAWGAAAQSYTYGIDPKRDEEAFAKFRKRMAGIRRKRPTVALVLSGGGAKGAAHLRIIKTLEEEGIPVDLVVGTSIGGLVGGLYACGYTADELEAIIRSMDWPTLMTDSHPRQYDGLAKKEFDHRFQFSLPFGADGLGLEGREIKSDERRRSLIPDGIVQGQNVRNLLSSLTVGYEDERDFLTLPTPFVCLATDVVTARPKIWHCGSLCDAMRSTMSIPGLFTPLRIAGMVLMDGGLQTNFPAEIAKKMGADIIIGVDISGASYQADEINNLVDIVYQTMDVMGRETYNAGVEAATVYIRPELSDFGMLSFDTESIDTIIRRGQEAADKNRDAIRAVKKRLRGVSAASRGGKAVNFADTPLRIGKVEFEGVSGRDKVLLRRMLNLDDIMSKADLDNAVARMLGTASFSSVTYDLLGNGEPYTVRFNCRMAPVNQVGISARFDTEEFAALLFNAGFNARRLTGHRLDLTARLGLKSAFKAEYNYRNVSGFNIGAEGLFRYVRNGDLFHDPYEYRLHFLQGRFGLNASLAQWNAVSFRASLRLDYFRFMNMLIDYRMPASAVPSIEYTPQNLYAGAVLQVRGDTFDAGFFPKRGFRWCVIGEGYLPGFVDNHGYSAALSGQLETALTMGRFTFLPSLYTRYYYGNTLEHRNFLSVGMAGRMLDQQAPFVGLNMSVACLDLLGTARLDVRFNLAEKHYLSAQAQVGHMATDFKHLSNPEHSKTFSGFALEYAYDFLAGPVKADIHWSNLTNGFGFYISFGLHF